MSDHANFEHGAPAYLLDALTPAEAEAFKAHAVDCALCRDELDRLRPAVDALARSVEPYPAPAEVRESVMRAVKAEMRAPAAPARLSLGARLRDAFVRPRGASWVAAATLAVVGAVAGWGVARQVSDEQRPTITSAQDRIRTVAVQIDRDRVPDGSGSLLLARGDAGAGSILRVQGLESPGPRRVYQVWLKRGEEISPASVFSVRADGSAAVGIVERLDEVDAVLVTREPAGGSRAPSEQPVMQASI